MDLRKIGPVYDIVFVQCAQKDLVAWLESVGEDAFVLLNFIRWTPMCTRSNAVGIAARVSAECSVVAIHTFRSEQNIWEMSIFDSGDCVSAVRCDWTNSKVIIDRSRLDLNVIEDLVPKTYPGMSAQVHEALARVQELQLQTLRSVLESDNWNYVMHDDRPDELIPQLLQLLVEDGLEFNELIRDREEDPEGFPLVYPGIVGVNV